MDWWQLVEKLLGLCDKWVGPVATVLVASGIFFSGGIFVVDLVAPEGGKFSDLLGWAFLFGTILCFVFAVGIAIQRAMR